MKLISLKEYKKLATQNGELLTILPQHTNGMPKPIFLHQRKTGWVVFGDDTLTWFFANKEQALEYIEPTDKVDFSLDVDSY